MKQRVGISVGMHNCYLAAKVSPDSPVSLINDAQFTKQYATPLVVAVQNGKVLVGKDVQNLINSKNYNKIVHNDRFIEEIGQLDVKPIFEEGEAWYPITLLAFVFKKLQHDAKSFTNEIAFDENIICVPDDFSDFQRGDIIMAAKLANLPVKKIVSKSEAVLEYYLESKEFFAGKTLLIDLSDRSTNLNFVVGNPLSRDFSNRHASFDMAGQAFSKIIRTEILSEAKKLGVEHLFMRGGFADKQLEESVEKIKIAYGTNTNLTLLQDIIEISGEYFRLMLNMRTIQLGFNEVVKSIINKIDAKMEDFGIDPREFDQILVTGGTSQIPELQAGLQEHFEGKPIHFLDSKSEKSAVFGAALMAEKLELENGSDVSNEKTEKNIGIAVYNPINRALELVSLFKTGAILPAERTKLFNTTRKNQTRIFLEIREYDSSINDSRIIATLSAETNVQMKIGHPIGIDFTYDEGGNITAHAYDQMTRKRLSCDLAMNDSGGINMLQQNSLLASTVILNNIPKPSVNRF